jgi:hypothetical protein
LDLLFADDVTSKFGRYVIYVLAVAGGFLVGNVLTLVLCRIIAHLTFKRRMYQNLEGALRILGGLAVAILVAYLLFRFGTGWGLGGTGSGEGESAGGPAANDSKHGIEKQPKVDPKQKDLETVISPVVQVRIEKATDYPRTFRFRGDAEGVDLAAAKKRLAELAKSAKGEPRLELQVYQNSTEAGHPDVRDLMDHAHSLRFATRVDKINDRLP